MSYVLFLLNVKTIPILFFQIVHSVKPSGTLTNMKVVHILSRNSDLFFVTS